MVRLDRLSADSRTVGVNSPEHQSMPVAPGPKDSNLDRSPALTLPDNEYGMYQFWSAPWPTLVMWTSSTKGWPAA